MSRNSITRRQFLRFSALGVVGTFLAACAPQAPAAEPTSAPAAEATSAPAAEATTAPAATAVPQATPAASSEKVAIRWLDWSELDKVVANTISKFNEKFPNVEVTFEPIGDQWGDKEITEMVSGTAPDVLTGNDETSYKWAEKKQLLDLNPLVERDLTPEQVGDFFDYQWKGLIYPGDGIRMGMPYYLWTFQYYFNKDAYDEIGLGYPKSGWTTDDYDAQMQKLIKKDASGKITRWGSIEVNDAFNLQRWMHMFGGNMVDPNDWTTCVLNSEQSKAAIEWLRKRLWDTNTIIQPMQANKQGLTDLLVQGKLALAGGGIGVVYQFINNPPPIKWATAVNPIGPTGKPTGIGTIDNWGIWKGSKAPDAAWELIKFLEFDPTFMTGFIGVEACAGARKSMFPLFKETVKKLAPSIGDEQLDPMIEMFNGGYIQIGEQFKKHKESLEIIQPALDKILQVGDTPVSILDDVAKQVTDLNHQA